MAEQQLPKLEELTREHVEQAFRLALRLTGNPVDAEDIAQEAFRRATQHWHTYSGKSTFKTWLFSILLNVFRSSVTNRNGESTACETVVADRRYLGPQALMEQRELEEHVAKLISSLPVRQREVLVLHFYHQCSHEEIGQMLELSPQNVRTNLHHARQKLQTQLKPYLRGD